MHYRNLTLSHRFYNTFCKTVVTQVELPQSYILRHHFYNTKSMIYEPIPSTGLILGLHPANEMSLQSNAVSQWLGANLESAPQYIMLVKFFV